jgi:hypothetical protein
MESGAAASIVTTPTPAARLLIHRPHPARMDDWSVESLIQHLRPSDADRSRRDRVPLKLEIHDLQGNSVLALDAAGALVEVALQPGTYHVTTQLGCVRRRYTINVESGASTDLHLPSARGRT